MRNRTNINSFFYPNRKVLYTVLGIVMASVLTLTVVYAALSTTLNINGNAEVTAASWDIYLDNVMLNSGSATSNIPTITDKTTATFSTTLTKPGDYYMFTIDVVNNGSIDAMINNITKIPELSDTQKKYLNYIVEYQNGESITTKQLVEKKSFVRLKVKVEFRKDLTVSDLPTVSETLSLSFKVNYVQSDDSNDNVTIDNSGKLIKVLSGDYDTVGSEICIKDECFYVISSDEESVTMLAKYNLFVGNECTEASISSCTPFGDEATGLQNSSMLSSENFPRKGTIHFSLTGYWDNESLLKNEYGASYPVYVYDNNSNLFSYINNYKKHIEYFNIKLMDARVIMVEELVSLGCNKSDNICENAPDWVYMTSYWTGSANNANDVWIVNSVGGFGCSYSSNTHAYGIRPVIVIPKSEF